MFARDPACTMPRICVAHRTPFVCVFYAAAYRLHISPQTRHITSQMPLARSSRRRQRRSMGSTISSRWRSTRQAQSRRWLSNVRHLSLSITYVCSYPCTRSGPERHDGLQAGGRHGVMPVRGQVVVGDLLLREARLRRRKGVVLVRVGVTPEAGSFGLHRR